VRVLVTGGMGFIGCHVVRALIAHGDRPIVVDIAERRTLLEEWQEQADFHVVDVTDLASLVAVCRSQNVSVIVHLAAIVGASSDDDPMRMFNVNMRGTMNVLEAARELAIRRVIMASTLNVYGSLEGSPHGHPTYRPVPEDHPLAPRRPYDVWKYAAERLGCYYRERFGLEFSAFRFAIYYAPERVARPGTRITDLLHAMICNAIGGTPSYLPGGAQRVMDCIYVRDLGRAAALAVHSERLPHNAYNIGSGVPTTLSEFAAAVRAAVPGARIEIGDRDPAPGPYCVLDTLRAKSELDFSPAWSLERGVADCVQQARKVVF
jgi:UDP-glucose 4-epimerase